MRERISIKGHVTISVLDRDGNVKRARPNWIRRLFGLPGKLCISCHHNIVTKEGDALIADALMPVSAKPKITSASGFMQVGTGWTGNSAKTNTRCNSPVATPQTLDNGYPVLKSAWGTSGDNTLVYRVTFEAGKLNNNGINEAALLNGNTAAAQCLAYAQITPSANVTSADTLQIVWEITLLGQ